MIWRKVHSAVSFFLRPGTGIAWCKKRAGGDVGLPINRVSAEWLEENKVTMGWKLFLDDQWDDENCIDRVKMPDGYIPARSSAEAIALVKKLGLPEHMMLDFDLGNGDSTERFLKWLVNRNTVLKQPIPGWSVHSENIIGQKWIADWMASWAKMVDCS